MKTSKSTWPAFSYGLTFLIGVILLWTLGKDWLDFESTLVFLAGLIGVAVAVLLFGAWNLRRNSHHEGN